MSNSFRGTTERPTRPTQVHLRKRWPLVVLVVHSLAADPDPHFGRSSRLGLPQLHPRPIARRQQCEGSVDPCSLVVSTEEVANRRPAHLAALAEDVDDRVCDWITEAV